MRTTTDGQPVWHRLCWFAGLWLAGVLSVGVVAIALRWLLHAA